MKIKKLTYGLLAATMFSFASCDINEYPKFDNANAFVAIQQTAASISETGDELQIPVMLTSLGGLNGSVDFEITPDEQKGAVEGTHYSILNESKTLNFTADAPTQYIKFKIIDNDVFGGDVKMTITLKNAQGVQLGANKTCQVTIEDNEHPLAFILGTMHAVGYDYFSGGAEEEWDATFEKDATDLNKVWIYNICSGGCSSSSPVYGIVTEDKTEIHIPVGQTTANTSSYDVILEGFRDGGETDIENGDYIVGKISPDGTITIEDWFGAHAYSAGTTNSAGWYAIEMGGVFKKQ
jgi:hypothetical protein